MAHDWLAFWSTWMFAAAWQAVVIVVAFQLAAWLAAPASPKVRFWIWQLAAIKLLVLPLWTHDYAASSLSWLGAAAPREGAGVIPGGDLPVGDVPDGASSPSAATASKPSDEELAPLPDLSAQGIVPLEEYASGATEPSDEATPDDENSNELEADSEEVVSTNSAGSTAPAVLATMTGSEDVPVEKAVAPPSSSRWNQILAAAFFLWAAGVVVRVACWGIHRRRLKFLLAGATAGPENLRHLASQAAAQLGLAKAPALLESPAVASPMVCSLGGPTVVLPSGLAPRLDPTALRLVLLHEFAHLARRDLAWAWPPELAKTLYWFHPAVYHAARRARLASELACDAAAIDAAGVSPRAYADALVAAVGGQGTAQRIRSQVSSLSEGDRP